MALAIRLEQLVQDGVVADYAELAWLGYVTRARMSQILKFLNRARYPGKDPVSTAGAARLRSDQ